MLLLPLGGDISRQLNPGDWKGRLGPVLARRSLTLNGFPSVNTTSIKIPSPPSQVAQPWARPDQVNCPDISSQVLSLLPFLFSPPHHWAVWGSVAVWCYTQKGASSLSVFYFQQSHSKFKSSKGSHIALFPGMLSKKPFYSIHSYISQ